MPYTSFRGSLERGQELKLRRDCGVRACARARVLLGLERRGCGNRARRTRKESRGLEPCPGVSIPQRGWALRWGFPGVLPSSRWVALYWPPSKSPGRGAGDLVCLPRRLDFLTIWAQLGGWGLDVRGAVRVRCRLAACQTEQAQVCEDVSVVCVPHILTRPIPSFSAVIVTWVFQFPTCFSV